MKFVKIKAGTFKMGSFSDQGKNGDETLHDVTLDEFEIMDAPVTQMQWQEIMGKNPSYFKGKDNPVEQVSYNDCQNFIKKMNDKKDGWIYRLPTEAEWEFCAKSCDSIPLDEQSWNYKNSNLETHPVKEKKANHLDLYDMLGNVWEWCQDWYGPYETED